ncbi:MAG TPA: protein kinase, partial [Kofleriaceae bacterium]|nr:protein kinase [Kofleriaceae bacterium]
IGEGGMGVVFSGRHTIIEKQVAIKVLKREVARDHSVVKRFVQEAKSASRIGHPSIVDVTDFGTTPDGMTYSVMEFVEGDTLSAVIRKGGPQPVARVLPIIAQIAKALGAAHEKGIVHRDLKPENVFVINKDGRKDFVKIVDFGIAKVMPTEGAGEAGQRLTRAGSVFGTPEYMAPEQAAGRPDTDRRVDVYALGTILYEMLVGKVPHKGESTVRTLAMQMLDPIVPPRTAMPGLDISDDLEAVIMTALAKKREERYPTMTTFLGELERAAGGVPLAQPRSASTSRVNKLAAGASERTLVPLPPGADGLPTHPEAGGNAASATAHEGAKRDTVEDALTNAAQRPARPRRASHGDPAFLSSADPGSLGLYDDDFETPATRSRWPALLLAALVLGGGAIAAVLLLRGSPADEVVTAGSIADAAVLAGEIADSSVGDATVVVEVTPDAAPQVGTKPPRKPLNGKDPVTVPPPPGRPTKVQVVTQPPGATLYIGQSYTGTGDTYITRPAGTKVTVTCRVPSYQAGSVEVSFDGVTDVYLCQMKRVKKCIRDLKNPFDDCPE